MSKPLFYQRIPFYYILLVCILTHSIPLVAQTASKQNKANFQGVVYEKEKHKPIPGATVSLPKYGVSVISDSEGMFSFQQIPVGDADIIISVIGMLTTETKINIGGKNTLNRFYLEEENFALDEVVVTAKNAKVGASTASSISRSAIDHLQATSLGDVLELLPGHLASNPTLNAPAKAVLRQAQTDALNSMGTSIVFNGAPISNNANLQIGNTAKDGALNSSFASTAGSGTDMRQIPVDNIESVDVIRGIPSVEYGDLTSGVIIINPKAGEYPVQVRLKINPVLTQASAGKGFDLGQNHGKLSFDVDYAKSLTDERRPNQAFERFTGNILYSKRIGESISSTTGLGFFTDMDATKLDPTDARYQRERSSKNTGLRLNTNMVWNANSDFLKYIRVNLSANYEMQKGYNQEVKGNFGYMITSATKDGTITSNREEIIVDANGQQITNNHILDPLAKTNILPYEFLTKTSVSGKPLNLFAKVLSGFFTESYGFSHRILLGADWKYDVNFGDGKTFDPMMPPSQGIRIRPYKDIPALNQLSFYAEDNLERTIMKRSFKFQFGLRADMIQIGRDDNKNSLSPRINTSYDLIPGVLTLRGGWGITAKAPPLMFLYPDPAYFDFVNYDNLGSSVSSQQKLSILTTKVYETTNKELKVAKNQKSEIGVDLNWKRMNFSVVAFKEKLKNGYSFGTDFNSFQLFDLIKYTGTERPGTYPILVPGIPNRITISYNTPLNDKINENKGVEFDFNFGQIKSIQTSFVLNGAWLDTKIYSTSNSFFQKSPNEDGSYKDIGVYGTGDGSHYERFSTNLRIIHNIPKIGFVISLFTQTIWKDKQQYLGLENKYPIGYLSSQDMHYTSIEPGQSIPNDIQKQILVNREITESYDLLWLFNLRLTKELKRLGGFAFFVNNLFNNNPMEESKRNPGNYTQRNPEQFFGAEVWFKF